jgi:transcription elongation factor GreB
VSKAFTKEDDLQESEDLPFRPALPPGARNYMTPGGAAHLQEQLASLEMKRHELIAVGDETRERELRRLETRVREISESLGTAEVVGVPETPNGSVCFGAFVVVRNPSGEETEYRIVGVDEVDYDRGWISWLSPLARALMHRHSGQRVPFQTPAGPREFTIVSVRYG